MREEATEFRGAATIRQAVVSGRITPRILATLNENRRRLGLAEVRATFPSDKIRADAAASASRMKAAVQALARN